ncbi:DUF2249 domain-containing protein [Mycobacterium vicinigordonae]|uniref:DUF2249 domain-containing protein n=1 Tax=Mycobacterium vicinigordonae TaxID=1719132 RepID=A0A7D6IQC0_9MYCO|nr:DUF2249 domain-containing protein [Mycobacterium vicinigordonae]QLL09420.1 DUF2249 domain-containing protein [Mycobacterium vicinigordonae]
MAENELDVRELRKPDKHPTIFARYDELSPGEYFVLVNNHDPKHLRAEFDIEHPGSYHWEYLARGPQEWRIRIGKRTTTSLPRVLTNTAELGDDAADATGAVWKLEVRARDLDANVVAVPPEGRIDTHTGPDLDVLIHVLSGSGRLTTEEGIIDMHPGALLWLPRRSRRQFTAGPDGLRYLTVHKRRQALVLEAPARRAV